MALPDSWCSLEEASEQSADIVRTLEFSYQSLARCFADQDNHPSLDHFFYLVFARLSNGIKNSDNLAPSRSAPDLHDAPINSAKCEFESIVPAAHFIHLPRDAQIQIDAALNEMEAMDYRDWVSIKMYLKKSSKFSKRFEC